ncbi:MAG: hypothetical protein V5A24_04405, partial [Haloarculaceae archaeon]
KSEVRAFSLVAVAVSVPVTESEVRAFRLSAVAVAVEASKHPLSPAYPRPTSGDRTIRSSAIR